jgi:hypothetical protein
VISAVALWQAADMTGAGVVPSGEMPL